MVEETTAVQDYLKAILQLTPADGKGVSTNALADRLGVRPPSVSAMVKRLDGEGLVRRQRYQGVKLTARGRRMAVEVVRHHRLLELYLERVVGMPWDKVHDEAERLEHVISEDLESRLDELLGFPTADPHGHPIPGPDLEWTRHDHPSLDSLAVGEAGTVREVDDDDPGLLRHLDELGLRPGASVRVLETIPYGGGIRAEVGGHEQIVGAEACEAVRVTTDDEGST